MNERIKQLRKALKLTQAEFAARLGLKQSAISLLESGDNSVTTSNVVAICRTFGCVEEWLRTGEGEMFPPRTREEELAAAFASVLTDDNEFKRRMIAALAALPLEAWEEIERFCEQLLEK